MTATAELETLIDSKFRHFEEGAVVNGTIIAIKPQVVLVDIGYKSEGAFQLPNLKTKKSKKVTK